MDKDKGKDGGEEEDRTRTRKKMKMKTKTEDEEVEARGTIRPSVHPPGSETAGHSPMYADAFSREKRAAHQQACLPGLPGLPGVFRRHPWQPKGKAVMKSEAVILLTSAAAVASSHRHRPGLAVIINHQSSIINHHPPSAIHRPPSTVHRPPSTVHRPPSTIHRAGLAYQRER
ncbi:hypothetical protein H113_01834 [Trichophyton rubrum MR1459]|nr:hypothetical protein H102_01824 [Trichophyton rubrum CBS 100081]EZF66259.1 hypothetical protein H104_01811 [Trichophyton rubrum CBS 289.86]EZF87658.1 hypothetical protein H110_01835 [Trichophyton rubrum MR1448]EZF98336.1 hypothetical protein H113_01834 [Trichophyton rubrum MR1459]EZG19898.1 hypothetical protein H107_01893 [Trichophyton rubrum CBS 202.88]KMQ45618.1 hypothetical protein HL42_3654 [Trichophyton rubrum]